MATPKLVDSEGLKTLLEKVKHALPKGWKRKAKLSYNENAAHYCPYSLDMTFAKESYCGFEVTGWRPRHGRLFGSRRADQDGPMFKGVSIYLKGASLRGGRERFHYPIRKDGTIAVDKIIKAITDHDEWIKKRAEASKQQDDLMSELRVRVVDLHRLLEARGLKVELYDGTQPTSIRLKGPHDRFTGIEIVTSRQVDDERPFSLKGLYLNYKGLEIVEVIDVMLSRSHLVREGRD